MTFLTRKPIFLIVVFLIPISLMVYFLFLSDLDHSNKGRSKANEELAINLRPTPDFAEDFLLIDHKGVSHELFRKRSFERVIIISQQNSDPNFTETVKIVKPLVDGSDREKEQFLFINATGMDRREDVNATLIKAGLYLPVLMDDAQIISENLGLRTTPEVIVILPQQKWKISYKGPLAELSDHLKKPDSEPSVRRPSEDTNAKIPYRKQTQLTFNQDIRPLVKKYCRRCHKPGNYPPENLSTYKEIVNWSPMIRETIRKGLMPAWNADKYYGGPFRNDRSMPYAETQKFIRWIESDQLEGEIVARREKKDKKNKRKPDFVLSISKTMDIPPDGYLKYQYVRLGGPFKKEKWIKKLRLKTMTPALLHHASLITITEEYKDKMSDSGPQNDGIQLLMSGKIAKNLIWAPGKTKFFRYPKGTGLHVEKNAQLVLELHYVGSGYKAKDKVKVAFVEHDKDTVVKPLKTILLRNKSFTIPPRIETYAVKTKKRILKKSIYAVTYLPHLHMRGKAVGLYAVRPGKKREVLVSVPRYDFNWQSGFRLQEPVYLEKGTKLFARALYDNSIYNPNNPDPDATVAWGHRSVENEMLNFNIGYFDAD